MALKPAAPVTPAPRLRELVTPEGAALRLQLGEAGERAAALLIDLAIMLVALIAMTLLALAAFALARSPAAGETIAIIWLIGGFVLRNFYFVWFESRAAAATPGKRIVGLRVAARHGGRLGAEAVFGRNAMREIELFLPLSFLGAQASQNVDGWIVLAGLVWCAIFALFPFLNADRLRAGDIVAGTWVVRNPKPVLLPDLAEAKPAAAYDFTPAQLAVYGEKELQVLESVLRQPSTETVREVALRIRLKIDWRADPRETDFEFLSAYYAALRAKLEAGLIMGRRRLDKHDQK